MSDMTTAPLTHMATLQSNPDLFTATAFKLPHNRPGTVSLSLSENDEEPGTKERTGYRPLEFLITTGPGPVPRLNEVGARLLVLHNHVPAHYIDTLPPLSHMQPKSQHAAAQHASCAWCVSRCGKVSLLCVHLQCHCRFDRHCSTGNHS